MKKIVFVIFLTSLASTSFSPAPDFRSSYSPVFLSREALESSVKYIPGARDMIQTGKIYYLAPYIYVNERYKGVHVIDNTNPAKPVNEGFILAPGCIDMAVKGKIIYLDNSVDLVSFDLESRQVTKRIRNVLPEPLPPEDSSFHLFDRPQGYVLVEWKKQIPK
jgi:hypothetical protein